MAFQLRKATCQYGDLLALDGVSVELEKGEQVAVIGPSGGGKTTLLRLLNTMRAPDRGRVMVFGQEISQLTSRELRMLRSRIATIPQDLGLVETMTVVQNVILGKGGSRGTLRSLRDVCLPQKADLLRIHQILDRVGIEEKLYSRVSTLSGGQKQRVAIARALFQEPEALIADEPVSSVDPARALDSIRLLNDLSREHDFTLCVSIHNVELARDWFPRLIALKKGRCVFDKAADDISDATLEQLYRLSADEMMIDA